MTAQLLDWAEHELRSIRSWLNTMYPSDTIWITRPDANFSRPALRITETAPREWQDQGRLLQQAIGNWQIEVLEGSEDDINSSENLWATRRKTSTITNKLLMSRLIPLYLWRWQYLEPQAQEVVGTGSIPAGQVSVRVSAINYEDEESLASEPVTVDVGANAALEILIPPWPRSVPVAKEFAVYAGALGAEEKQVVVPRADGPVGTMVSIPSLVSGDPPPTDSRFFSLRFMRIDQVESETLEHPEMDGVFNGFVSLRTLTTMVRDPVVTWDEPLADLTSVPEVS